MLIGTGGTGKGISAGSGLSESMQLAEPKGFPIPS